MNKPPILFLILAGLLLWLASSCGNWDQEIVKNRENLSKLRKDMTRAEVLAIMGEPIKDHKYCQPDIWFYYSYCHWSDSMITRDECTPVVFVKDRVAGWGWDYYKEHVVLVDWEAGKK